MMELSRKGEEEEFKSSVRMDTIKTFAKVLHDPTSMTTSIKTVEKVGEVGLQKVVNDEEKISKVKVKELKECNSRIAVKVDVLKHGRKLRDHE